VSVDEITGIKTEHDKSIKKYGLLFLHFVISYVIVLQLILSSESGSQVPIDDHFYSAMLVFLGYLMFLKGRELNIIPIAVSTIVGVIIMACVFRLKDVSAATYGPVLFRVIVFSWLIVILSIAVVVDAIVDGTFWRAIKSREVVFFVIVFSLTLLFNARTMVPVVLPLFALLIIKLNHEKVDSFMACFALGYYVAFLHMILKSIIQNPERYEDGRFLGSFGQVESAGMFCGGAIVCVLFLLVRYLWSDNVKWQKVMVLLTLFALPVFFFFKIASRSTMFALFIMMFLSYIFLFGKMNSKGIGLRALIAIAAIVVCFALLLFLSNYWRNSLASGKVESLDYFKSHIAVLTDPICRTGHFKDGSILNVIDRACSGRLAIWDECIKQISWRGHQFTPVDVIYGERFGSECVRTPHNFFIMWFIQYGIIGGILMVAHFLRFAGISIKMSINRHQNSLLQSLWIMYVIAIFSFTCVTWKYPVAFILLFMQCFLSKEKMRMSEKI